MPTDQPPVAIHDDDPTLDLTVDASQQLIDAVKIMTRQLRWWKNRARSAESLIETVRATIERLHKNLPMSPPLPDDFAIILVLINRYDQEHFTRPLSLDPHNWKQRALRAETAWQILLDIRTAEAAFIQTYETNDTQLSHERKAAFQNALAKLQPWITAGTGK